MKIFWIKTFRIIEKYSNNQNIIPLIFRILSKIINDNISLYFISFQMLLYKHLFGMLENENIWNAEKWLKQMKG